MTIKKIDDGPPDYST